MPDSKLKSVKNVRNPRRNAKGNLLTKYDPANDQSLLRLVEIWKASGLTTKQEEKLQSNKLYMTKFSTDHQSRHIAYGAFIAEIGGKYGKAAQLLCLAGLNRIRLGDSSNYRQAVMSGFRDIKFSPAQNATAETKLNDTSVDSSDDTSVFALSTQLTKCQVATYPLQEIADLLQDDGRDVTFSWEKECYPVGHYRSSRIGTGLAQFIVKISDSIARDACPDMFTSVPEFTRPLEFTMPCQRLLCDIRGRGDILVTSNFYLGGPGSITWVWDGFGIGWEDQQYWVPFVLEVEKRGRLVYQSLLQLFQNTV